MSLSSNLRRRARRRARRRTSSDLAGRILETGMLDLDWYNARTGRQFASPVAAAQHYARWGASHGLSPNPLFEPSVVDGPVGLRGDRFLSFLQDSRNPHRALSSPHPVWDLETYLSTNPDARQHRFGPLGHLWERLEAKTPIDLALTSGAQRPWSELRAELLHHTSLWRSAAQQRKTVRSASLSATDDSAPIETLVAGEPPEVSFTIVMASWNRAHRIRAAARSVQEQTWDRWRLIIVDDGSTDDTRAVVRSIARSDDRIEYLPREHEGVCAARNAGIEVATGDLIAFLDTDNSWRPEYLEVMAHAMASTTSAAAFSSLQQVKDGTTRFRSLHADPELLRIANYIDLNALVVRTETLRELGGFDESLPRAVDYDLVLRLADRGAVDHVPYVGIDYTDDSDADRISIREPVSWNHVVQNRHVVDFTDLLAEPREADTIVVPLKHRPEEVMHVVRQYLEHFADQSTDFSLVSGPVRWRTWIRYVSLAMTFRRCALSLLRGVVSHSVATNVGAARARTDRLLLWDMDDRMTPAIMERLLRQARTAGSALVQPMQLAADGTIRGLGGALPPRSGTPVPALGGLPPETATLDRPDLLPVPVLWGQTMAMPSRTFVAAGGLDALLVNAHEGPDFGLRRGGAEARYVLTTTRAVHASVSTRRWRPRAGINERVLSERYRAIAPIGLEEPVREAGLSIGHWRSAVDFRKHRHVPLRPLLVRSESRGSHPSPLRWAIKTAAPVGPLGDLWGDTHFATSLARAFSSLGEQVGVDRRQAHYRTSGYLDDVNLVLRGLDAVRPDPARINVLWVISHPDMVSKEEVEDYDLVYAASESWAAHRSEDWSLEIRPLLQCTDASLFDVDRIGSVSDDRSLLFVGNSRKVNRPSVRVPVAHDIPIELYGPNWEPFVDDGLVRATFVPNDELPQLYASSGAVLNDHWDDMYREGFVSNRLFDAVAVGARVFSDDLEGLEELFGGSVRTWRSETEMIELLRTPLDATFPDRPAREAIARRVRDAHSFLARAQVLLEDVRKIHDDR